MVKNAFNIKSFLLGLLISILVLVSALGGAIADRLFGIKPLDYLFSTNRSLKSGVEQRLVNEESAVTLAAESVSPSVVTVSIQTPQRSVLQFNPFGGGFSRRIEGGDEQDIGSGFIVSKEGLIVTNKHVVATDAQYKVITSSNVEYEVKEINRDPSNDIAILRIEPLETEELIPVVLGDSSNLKVGQFVIAIGTALGEFRHTVTTGVISGLGRGITAGSAFEGFVERLDNVIQTDAAINPGNSGGPLLNSSGEVIGVNVAVAQGAQNIGFAIPISVVKDGLDQFAKTGKFASRPFLGVSYQMIGEKAALLNEVPQGAYVIEVVAGSPAEKAGIAVDDIITKLDGKELQEDGETLAEIVSDKKVGDSIEIEVYRDGETINFSADLSEFVE